MATTESDALNYELSKESLFHKFHAISASDQEKTYINPNLSITEVSSSNQTLESAFAFYPRGSTIVAATAAIIFIVTGVIGNVAVKTSKYVCSFQLSKINS
jgi:hypothetical protein